MLGADYQLLSRINTISASQILSILIRSTPHGVGMKGSDARDALFARLFGINALIQSNALFSSSTPLSTFQQIIDELTNLGQAKGWLRESAWWGIQNASERLLDSEVEWKDEATEFLVGKVYGDKAWSQEKVALTLLLEKRQPVGLCVLRGDPILIIETELEDIAAAYVQAYASFA